MWPFSRKQEVSSWFMSAKECYETILYPFEILCLDPFDKKMVNESLKYLETISYRQAVFELNLFGSDEVVKIYKEMMNKTPSDGYEFMRECLGYFAKLVLAIRRHIGPNNTNLKTEDFLMIDQLNTILEKSEELLK